MQDAKLHFGRRKRLTLLGSMVQKGKFSAGIDTLPRVLKRVLLPTLGSPTMPICNTHMCGNCDDFALRSTAGAKSANVDRHAQKVTWSLQDPAPSDWI